MIIIDIVIVYPIDIVYIDTQLQPYYYLLDGECVQVDWIFVVVVVHGNAIILHKRAAKRCAYGIYFIAAVFFFIFYL